MNKKIEELLSIISEGQNSIQLQEIEKYITNLQKENQKLNKIIDELEKYLEESIGQDMYRLDFQFILNKLTELKKGAE